MYELHLNSFLNQFIIKVKFIRENCFNVHPFGGVKNFYADYFILRCCIYINPFVNFNNSIRFLIPKCYIYGINLIVIMHSHFFLPFFSG
jgi:hypothetical protein